MSRLSLRSRSSFFLRQIPFDTEFAACLVQSAQILIPFPPGLLLYMSSNSRTLVVALRHGFIQVLEGITHSSVWDALIP